MWTDAYRLTYKLSGPLYPAERGMGGEREGGEGRVTEKERMQERRERWNSIRQMRMGMRRTVNENEKAEGTEAV